MQLILPFKTAIEYGEADFIVSACNYDAYYATLRSKWSSNRMLIVGEKGSGKSHLANIWLVQNNATLWTEQEDYTHQAAAILAEDIEKIGNEATLFHTINHCHENNIPLLLTATCYPAFKLKDLQSRINATPLFLIQNPDLELMRIILHKQFFDRQISVSPEVVTYILTRIERTFNSIANCVEQIDDYSIATKRMVTIPMVKTLLDSNKA